MEELIPKYTPSKDAKTFLSSSKPHNKQYKDLTSIDWIHEYQQSVLPPSPDLSSILSPFISQFSQWIVIILTGLLTGLTTSILDHGYKWLSDLKTGVCSDGFFHSYSACCSGVDGICEKWKQWDELFGLAATTGGSTFSKFVVFLITSLILACLAAFVCSGEKFVRTSGISETKSLISGVVIEGFLSLRTLIVKWIGLLLVVSSGIWAGKEGPLVHVSLCLAGLIIKWFPELDSNHARKREVLLAASAVGISVAFNAPISGVIFTLEQMTSFFNPGDKLWMSFICSMIGVVVLNFFKESLEVFVKMDNQWLGFELPGFIFLGVLGGFYGSAFNRLNLWFANWRRNHIQSHEIGEIAILSLITSCITYPLILPRLPLTSLIAILFKDCDTATENLLCSSQTHSGSVILLLTITFIFGFVLTAYTFGTSIPAGILMPSLVLGSIGGRILGLVFEQIQNSSETLTSLCSTSKEMCISPAAYAVVGSAAFVAGVTKMTVWCVVTVFELTGALTYVLPIMISVIVARLVNDGLDQMNCYDYWIEFFNYPYLHDIRKNSLPAVKVGDVFAQKLDFERNYPTIYCDQCITVSKLKDFISNHQTASSEGAPILNNAKDRCIVGWVSFSDLEDELTAFEINTDSPDDTEVSFFLSPSYNISKLDLSHIVEKFYTVLNSDTMLSEMVDIFFKLKSRYVVICDEGQFRGVIRLKEVSDLVKLGTNKIQEMVESTT